MALALETGRVSPRKMLREMSLRELGTWAALWKIDPWGEQRADQRQALTTAVIAETHRNSKRKSTPFKAEDFMPYANKDREAKNREVSARLRSALTKKGD